MEEYTITQITPEQFGYEDRGVKKWMGLMLADHNDALKKELNNYVEIEAKEEMSEIEISQVLHNAFVNDRAVLIQANVLRNGNFYKDVECKIAGYAQGQIHLKLRDGRTTSCTLEEIRNVELMNMLDWYDKQK